jgi:hypothetical protein
MSIFATSSRQVGPWPRKFPSAQRQRAEELGPVELIALLEWQLRNRPRALRNCRGRYASFCFWLYRYLARAQRGALMPKRIL